MIHEGGMTSSVTLVTACESARQPSSDLSEPVHTTPSANVSGAVMIYLQTQKWKQFTWKSVRTRESSLSAEGLKSGLF